jgi:glycosyltransferase involved in cell wall biosynthesis
VCYLSTAQEPSLPLFEGLDWLLFCEQPADASVLAAAKRRGVRVGCVVMWEGLDELAPWLDQIDLFLCPTRYCYEAVSRLRERRELSCEAASLPWTVDCGAFSFRERTICRRFLFINGHGGGRIEGESAAWDGRKGARFISEAARLVPEIPILVRSQTDRLPSFPANVEVRIADVSEERCIYEEGDVCVQPSKWEGLGMQLLECRASGLPLITTDGPPMNELAPFALIPARKSRRRIYNGRLIPVYESDVPALADLLRRVYLTDIRAASREAYRQVREGRSLEAFRRNALEILQNHPSAH